MAGRSRVPAIGRKVGATGCRDRGEGRCHDAAMARREGDHEGDDDAETERPREPAALLAARRSRAS